MTTASINEPGASTVERGEAPRATEAHAHPPAGFAKPSPKPAADPFLETYFFKVNSPDGVQAFWLRMTLLVSHHGFKRQADAWAIFSRRGPKREVQRTAAKQSFEIESFSAEERGARLGPCVLELPERLKADGSAGRPGRTRGSVQSKGQSIEWDLTLEMANSVECSLVPESLQRLGLVKTTAVTLGGDLRVSGTTTIGGQKVSWSNASGMVGHITGPSSPHSWVWGHSNVFSNEKGEPAEFVFEGVTARARLLGPIPAPKLSCLYFLYKGKMHRFNTFWDAIRVRSRHSLTEWRFQADHGELSFRGHASAEHRDFTGVTYEDTNGGLLYCANSKLANLQVHVYRRGKLEAAFYSNGAAAFELVSHQKNPYVPILL